MFQTGKYLAKLQARTWLSRALSPSFSRVLARRTEFLFVSFAKYSPLEKKTISLTDSATKPFLIWLSTTQPHLKYVATLPYNLSSMVCFADINVSQGGVATYASCGGIFNIPLTTNLPRNFPAKFF